MRLRAKRVKNEITYSSNNGELYFFKFGDYIGQGNTLMGENPRDENYEERSSLSVKLPITIRRFHCELVVHY